MKKVLAISCGLTQPKKRNIYGKRNLYLNYGLLGLCTILADKGYDIKQFQGDFFQPCELIDIINRTEYAVAQIEYPVLISIISFYSLEWCKELVMILKKEYGKKIILGGKYVVDGNIAWLKEQLPDVDVFLDGAGERKIEEALNTLKNTRLEYFDSYAWLDYSLLYDYKKYNPVIELSRGCGRGCSFCADRNRRPCGLKPVPNIIKEIEKLDELYEYQDYSLYLQAPTFSPNEKWTQSLLKESDYQILKHPWRCTSRVDTCKIEYLPALKKSGLKIIDLGLESASKQQLLNMKKTIDPVRYLEMADKLIYAANENGIWIKLNILLSAGETKKTVYETVQWLKKREDLVKGVSVSLETIFGPNNSYMMDHIKSLGASCVNTQDLKKKGYANINLSTEIDYNESLNIAKTISRMMMTADDYFELKKIGYFSRFYTRRDFYNDLRMDDTNVAFRISDTERHAWLGQPSE